MCFAPQRRALFRRRNFQKWSEPVSFLHYWLGNVLRATTAYTFSTSQLPKVVREWCALYIFVSFWLENVLRATTAYTFSTSQLQKKLQSWRAFYILTWKCASRHRNFQKWSEPVSFYTIDLEMCFAPQRPTLFRHRNFQKLSKNGVLCTFWLGNVLRPTTAYTFSTSQLPKVVREWCALYIFVSFWLENVLRATTAYTFSTSQLQKKLQSWRAFYILTWKCASRHNGLHFFDIATSKSCPRMVCFVHFDLEMCFPPQRRAIFISHLASWLRTRRFSEPTFQPSWATNL